MSLYRFPMCSMKSSRYESPLGSSSPAMTTLLRVTVSKCRTATIKERYILKKPASFSIYSRLRIFWRDSILDVGRCMLT